MQRFRQFLTQSFSRLVPQPAFWLATGVATVGYFTGTHFLQAWLYRGLERPTDLFASFGEKFLDAEPLEIPLYFLGYAVIPLSALALLGAIRRWWPVIVKNRKLWWVGAAAVLVGIVWTGTQLPWGRGYDFLWRAVGYVQARGMGRALWLASTKRIFISTLLLIGTALTFGISAWASRRRQFSARPPARLEAWMTRWGWLTVPVVAAVVFHPNFPVESHHASYFLAPVNDQLLGKPLLYETSSMYGILSHYFLLAIFGLKLLPLSYPALIAVLMVVFFGFLVGLYFTLRYWLRSPTYAVAGTLAVTTILFLFQTSPTRSVYHFPALTPFRFWLSVPVLAALVHFHRTGRWPAARAAVALSAVAIFWNLETGAAVAAATLVTLLFASRERFVLRLAKLLGELAGWALGIFVMISGVNWLVYGRAPLWLLYLKEIGEYSRGIAMYPLPAVGIFELFVIAAVLVLLWQLQRPPGVAVDVPLTFVTLLGAFAMIHYVGESTWQTLFMAAWPFVALAVVLADRLAITPPFYGRRWAVAALAAGAFFFVGLLVVKLPVELGNRDYRTIVASFREPPARDRALLRDAAAIRRTFADVRIPLLHFRDAKLLAYAGKTNWFNVYYSFNLYYKSQVIQLAEAVTRERPRVVLIGNGSDATDTYERNRAQELQAFFTPRLPSDYVVDQQLETLTVYRRTGDH